MTFPILCGVTNNIFFIMQCFCSIETQKVLLDGERKLKESDAFKT